MIFNIPYPDSKRERSRWNKRFSMNAYYAGKHWTQRKEDAEFWHLLTRSAIARNGAAGLRTIPVEIIFYWDDGLDVDNHAVMGKMILDALKGVVIPDDSPKYVKAVTHRMWDGGKIQVEVRPWE